MLSTATAQKRNCGVPMFPVIAGRLLSEVEVNEIMTDDHICRDCKSLHADLPSGEKKMAKYLHNSFFLLNTHTHTHTHTPPNARPPSRRKKAQIYPFLLKDTKTLFLFFLSCQNIIGQYVRHAYDSYRIFACSFRAGRKAIHCTTYNGTVHPCFFYRQYFLILT